MRLLLITVFIFLGACSSLSTRYPKKLNLNVKKEVLPNGLTVLLVKNEKLPIFSIQVHYRIGSKNEKAGMSGATHFLEHLMFKGAK